MIPLAFWKEWLATLATSAFLAALREEEPLVAAGLVALGFPLIILSFDNPFTMPAHWREAGPWIDGTLFFLVFLGPMSFAGTWLIVFPAALAGGAIRKQLQKRLLHTEGP